MNFEMNNDKSFIIGFGTLAFAEFLGYHWSPDYFEFVSNGNNYLWLVGFSISVLIMFFIIDNLKKETNE